MYIIETHYLKHAFAKIILEKTDATATYEQLSNYRLITNHADNLTSANCRWCGLNRRAELLRERKKEICSGIASLR